MSGGIGVSYYQLTFEPAVDRAQEPVAIIAVDPGDGVAPRRAVDLLQSGGVLVFPTERGYLVGCSALDDGAVRRLCEVTGARREDLLTFAASDAQAAALGVAPRAVEHPVAVGLMRAAGVPLAAAPCRPGSPPVPSAQHAVFLLGDAVDLVLNAGPVRP